MATDLPIAYIVEVDGAYLRVRCPFRSRTSGRQHIHRIYVGDNEPHSFVRDGPGCGTYICMFTKADRRHPIHRKTQQEEEA